MQKIPIIILPGWNTTSAKYQDLSSVLKQEGLINEILDLPGFGKVEHAGRPLHLADYVDFFDDFRKKNKLAEMILLGHSFGGRLALKYTQKFPEHVQALILSGTPGYLPVKRIKWLVSLVISKIGNLFFGLPQLARVADRVRVWFYKLVGAIDFYRADPVMRLTFKQVVAEELKTAMLTIQVPTILIWGEHDPIVPLKVGKQMTKTIANSKLVVIPNAGHRFSQEELKLFAKAVKDFLQNL